MSKIVKDIYNLLGASKGSLDVSKEALWESFERRLMMMFAELPLAVVREWSKTKDFNSLLTLSLKKGDSYGLYKAIEAAARFLENEEITPETRIIIDHLDEKIGVLDADDEGNITLAHLVDWTKELKSKLYKFKAYDYSNKPLTSLALELLWIAVNYILDEDTLFILSDDSEVNSDTKEVITKVVELTKNELIQLRQAQAEYEGVV